MSRYQHQIPISKLPDRVWADKPGLDLAEQLEASIDEVTQRNCNERKTMGDKLVLRTNEWAEVALKWPDGKNLYEFTIFRFEEVDEALRFFFAFAHRFCAAFFAAADRSSGVIFA